MSTMPVGRIRPHYVHLIQEICLQYFLRPNSERTCSNVHNVRIVSCFCNGYYKGHQCALSRIYTFYTTASNLLMSMLGFSLACIPTGSERTLSGTLHTSLAVYPPARGHSQCGGHPATHNRLAGPCCQKP